MCFFSLRVQHLIFREHEKHTGIKQNATLQSTLVLNIKLKPQKVAENSQGIPRGAPHSRRRQQKYNSEHLPVRVRLAGHFCRSPKIPAVLKEPQELHCWGCWSDCRMYSDLKLPEQAFSRLKVFWPNETAPNPLSSLSVEIAPVS